ncbi:hypothetical protein ACFWHW_03795 [Streptomyces pharetrae]|uniref:hypothetical protein n=1 Tax=Streptomyces pharetrae TaxID=291370 RepID=UPI00366774BA
MAADDKDYRVISRDLSPDHRIIAVVKNGGEDQASDDEILDRIQERTSRHLRAVDDREGE